MKSSREHSIALIAQRHGFSTEAAREMLDALAAGHGKMAQFKHAEFAGHGQWIRGGMTMVSDMFNEDLKARVDALCTDLAQLPAEPRMARDHDAGIHALRTSDTARNKSG